MLVVGLTGGIASGKSAVSQLFERHGVPVIDADVIARQVVEPGSAGLAQVAKAFGEELIGADGALDRRRLRALVFGAPAHRQRLEAILHPLIRAELTRQLAALTAPYALLVAPLLIETGLVGLVDRVLVVDTPEALQLQRVMARDGGSLAEARAILVSQLGRDERLAHADDVIRNDAGPAALEPEVERLHRRYLRLAAGSPHDN